MSLMLTSKGKELTNSLTFEGWVQQAMALHVVADVNILCKSELWHRNGVFYKKDKDRRNMFGGCAVSQLWGKGVPLPTHAEASLPPERPST